jgi:hypothetical protein
MFKSINMNISIDMVILGLSYIIMCQLGDMPSIFFNMRVPVQNQTP